MFVVATLWQEVVHPFLCESQGCFYSEIITLGYCIGWFVEILFFFLRRVQSFGYLCAYFDEIALLATIFLLKRESISTELFIVSIWFLKVVKSRYFGVEVLITVLNFNVRDNRLVYRVFLVFLSIFIVIVNKVRIVHDIFQKVRSMQSHCHKYSLWTDALLISQCELMFILRIDDLVLEDCCSIVDSYRLRALPYKFEEKVVCEFGVDVSSIRLVECWPLFPLAVFLSPVGDWFKSFHEFRIGWVNLLHKHEIYLFGLRNVAVDLWKYSTGSSDFALVAVIVFVSKPQNPLLMQQGASQLFL